jgi:hypothetical protein
MTRGNLNLPFSSPANGLRFEYEDGVGRAPSLADLNRSFASAMFTSPFLRKGMSFSAGAQIGSHPSPFAGVNGYRGTADKGSVPSVAMKLSF